jgi:hypothetical protein
MHSETFSLSNFRASCLRRRSAFRTSERHAFEDVQPFELQSVMPSVRFNLSCLRRRQAFRASELQAFSPVKPLAPQSFMPSETEKPFAPRASCLQGLKPQPFLRESTDVPVPALQASRAAPPRRPASCQTALAPPGPPGSVPEPGDGPTCRSTAKARTAAPPAAASGRDPSSTWRQGLKSGTGPAPRARRTWPARPGAVPFRVRNHPSAARRSGSGPVPALAGSAA